MASGDRQLTWQISLVPAQRYLVARTEGSMQVEDLRRLVAQLIEEAGRQDLVRALIDCRTTQLAMSKTDIYAFTSLVERSDLRRDMRAAIVIAPKTRDLDDYLFYETVAANNGWSVRVFADIDEAAAWLARESGSSVPPV